MPFFKQMFTFVHAYVVRCPHYSMVGTIKNPALNQVTIRITDCIVLCTYIIATNIYVRT